MKGEESKKLWQKLVNRLAQQQDRLDKVETSIDDMLSHVTSAAEKNIEDLLSRDPPVSEPIQGMTDNFIERSKNNVDAVTQPLRRRSKKEKRKDGR